MLDVGQALSMILPKNLKSLSALKNLIVYVDPCYGE